MISRTNRKSSRSQNLNVLQSSLICPKCHRSSLYFRINLTIQCESCRSVFPEVAGFPDLRTHSDHYLSLNQERQKAIRLSKNEPGSTLEELTRTYYRMTADVDQNRRERFVRHVMDADQRGQALLSCLPKTGSILEIGCGTGGFIKAAVDAGRTITGIDIASRWLVVARKRVSMSPNRSLATLLPACAECIPLPDSSVDIIVADSLLEHLPEPESAISEMIRLLKPSGCIFIWSPNRYWLGPDPHVGLWAIGLLPRPWGERYKKWRRGGIFWPLTRSPKEWFEMIRAYHPELQITYQSADTRAWPLQDKSSRALAAIALGSLSCYKLTRWVLSSFGPIGQILIKKPAFPIDTCCKK